MSAFFVGMIAGYGIAIPVGAIAVLILDLSLQRGFRAGFAAGAGAASVDVIYAALAAITGELIAPLVGAYAGPFQLASAAVLIAIGIRGLWRISRLSVATQAAGPNVVGGARLYVQFLGLTLLNPLTVAYFGALILGGAAQALNSALERSLFVIGAGVASFSWQTFLAALGAAGHRRFSPRLRLMTSLAGNLIVMGFGLSLLLAFLR